MRKIIRLATKSDIQTISTFDELAQTQNRKQFIEQSVHSGNAFVALIKEQPVAYAVLEYSFYSQGFISMLYVSASERRKGYGQNLIKHLESICKTKKIFTSTNESNLPMQTLLVKLGYSPSGIINNLDENDPEIIYFKRLFKT
jgi:GNAT superfamily N-acetyltransferase